MVDQNEGGGMTNSCNMNVTFNADDVNAALEAAWNEGFLCAPCMEKIAKRAVVSQSDFCPACQAAVTSQLMAAVEGRLREALVRKGLPPDSVQIASD